jgi:nucleoside-diphosphate-sugar epimerase
VWSDLNLVGDYAASKLEAEKAGWDFAKRHSDVLEVSTVCPTMITGPAIGNPNVVSEEFMTSLMYNQPTGVKLASNYYVDVRDVAKAHYRAVVVPEAANRRFLVHGTQPYTLDEICSLIDSTFPGKFRPAGHDGMDGSAAIGISNNNSASRDVLGMDYVPFEDTVKDMIDSLIRSGKIAEIEQKLQHQEVAAAQQEVLAVA